MRAYLELIFLILLKKGMRSFIKGSLKGLRPFKDLSLPLMIGIYIHIMERGIKRVRLINNLKGNYIDSS